MTWHLFSDMDGTLLDQNGQLTNQTIRTLQQLNLPLTLVSARAPIEMTTAIQQLNLTTPQIGFNGGIIFQGTGLHQQIIYECPLEWQTARTLVQALRQRDDDVSLSFFTRDHWFSDKHDKGIEIEAHYGQINVQLVDFWHFFQQTEYPIFKITLIFFDELQLADTYQFIQQLQLPDISVYASGYGYLEITHKEATKAVAIQFIQQHYQLVANQCIGIGDSQNDLPLFQQVEHRIAMGNAAEELKQQADFITRTNQQNGFAYALTHYVQTLIASTPH